MDQYHMTSPLRDQLDVQAMGLLQIEQFFHHANDEGWVIGIVLIDEVGTVVNSKECAYVDIPFVSDEGQILESGKLLDYGVIAEECSSGDEVEIRIRDTSASRCLRCSGSFRFSSGFHRLTAVFQEGIVDSVVYTPVVVGPTVPILGIAIGGTLWGCNSS